ncbi:hypothetical protein MC885_014584 [Smutsia gigantea]|nr:hypothetical protein MC885_014584 [Smutsia gigantea]
MGLSHRSCHYDNAGAQEREAPSAPEREGLGVSSGKRTPLCPSFAFCEDFTDKKIVKKTEIGQHAKYLCSFCGKTKMKKQAMGTWHRSACVRTAAGGARPCSATAAGTAQSAVRRPKALKDKEK